MPFDATDIRSELTGGSRSTTPPSQAASADYLRFYDLPGEQLEGHLRWRGRSQNLVVDLLDVSADCVIALPDGPDETGLLLPEPSVGAVVTAGGEESDIAGETLTFIPPGPATVRFPSPGRVVMLSTTRTPGLTDQAINAADYAVDHPNIPPLTPWPEPRDGYRIRTYRLDVPTLGTPPFRLFRCSSFMVNYIDPRTGPRDTTKMSPHDHDDFEQLSLILDGEYVHHLRWPWTTDLDQWREDEHERLGAPSLTVIPPPTIHTSQAIGTGRNHLIDIFSPPRRDFSTKEGWVLNAEDYPMPEDAEQ